MILPNPFVVVLDTCVLAPMPLCDTLLRLAEEPAFYLPKWSAKTLDELHRVLVRRWRHSPAQAARRLNAMAIAFPDATVTGYEALEAAMTNAWEDRHVLAAAVRCKANAIVTANTRDFPAAALAPYDIERLTPDAFLLHQFHLAQHRFETRLAEQARDAGFTAEQLLQGLQRHAPQCVATVREHQG